MKVTRRDEAEEFVNGPLEAVEYSFGDPTINVARVTVHGRYPAEGRAVNETTKELCYVLEGSGSICVEGEMYTISAGDALLIQPGERYYWDAEVVLLIPTTPAWTAEQHKHVA